MKTRLPPAHINFYEPGPIGIEKPNIGALNRPTELHPRMLCPRCQEGHLDYDGLLNLSCPKCGFTLAGCFT